jgi:Zn finger protein HypA/HybF involved in hydrogenase expression
VHEFGLAADIVHGVQAEAAAVPGRRLDALDVEVGALERLETETLAFWLAEELADHLDDASIGADRIRVVRLPLRLICRRCGHESTVPAEDDLVVLDPAARRCAACGSEDVAADGATGWTIEARWAAPAAEGV